MKFFGSKGILGINARNLLYIKPYNPKKAISLADDKIKTKKFLEARGIPVPKLINAIRKREEVDKFDFDSLPTAFVLKPNCGFGGEGIIPIAGKREGNYVTVNGEIITKEEMKRHILDILDGRFSISNIGDTAFFEQLLITHESLRLYTYEGLPDIRIIVHNLVPVMAMLRLPTKESHGKANLHQGAIGVGIDIETGKTTFISKNNKIINEIPGVGKMERVQMPFWDKILLIASKVQLATNLGYLAADIALDKNAGPVILEINARAGLGVQIANLAPLRKRLEKVKGIKVMSPEKGVRIAKDMFGRTNNKEEENTASKKKIISGKENVELITSKGTYKTNAFIDPSREKTILDEKLAEKLNLMDGDDYSDEKSTLKIKFVLKKDKIQTVSDIENFQRGLDYQMVIGARDLKNFLIDPSLTPKIKQEKQKKKDISNFDIDHEIASIDGKIKLLFHLRPTNLEEEQKKFLKDFSYNPKFVYPEVKFDPFELKQRLHKIEIKDPTTPIGKIFEDKKQELIKKIELIEHIDEDDFTQKSVNLFGAPSKELLMECEKMLMERDKHSKEEKEVINAIEASKAFEEIFKKYGLSNWKVQIKEDMVTDCTAGKNSRLFVRKNAQFSQEKIKSLIIHEIETHILTAENGRAQQFEIFNRGMADYLETQEGLAIYNVSTQLKKPIKNNTKALGLVIATEIAMESSFAETFEKILSYGIPIEQALRITVKVKRGLCDTSKKGAFTKDILYYQGYKQIENFVKEGGSIKDLYIGKINLKDLSVVQNIQGINPPRYLPDWL